MIYLIGGSPRCGKTILSKTLSRKIGVSFISTDAIRLAILKAIPKSEIKKKFPQEVMSVPKGKFRLDVYSSKKMLRAQLREAKTMWKPMKALIVHLIDSEQHYIIEGIHIFPELVNTLRSTKYWRNIRVVYLVKTDLVKIKTGFTKNKTEFDWMFPSIKKDPARIEKAAYMVKVKSEYIEQQAKKHHLKVLHTDKNFHQSIVQAQRYLLR